MMKNVFIENTNSIYWRTWIEDNIKSISWNSCKILTSFLFLTGGNSKYRVSLLSPVRKYFITLVLGHSILLIVDILSQRAVSSRVDIVTTCVVLNTTLGCTVTCDTWHVTCDTWYVWCPADLSGDTPARGEAGAVRCVRLEVLDREVTQPGTFLLLTRPQFVPEQPGKVSNVLPRGRLKNGVLSVLWTEQDKTRLTLVQYSCMGWLILWLLYRPPLPAKKHSWHMSKLKHLRHRYLGTFSLSYQSRTNRFFSTWIRGWDFVYRYCIWLDVLQPPQRWIWGCVRC